MRQTRKLRGGATPIQIRAYQTRSSKPRSSKSGRQLSRKYRFPAADYFERIMAQIMAQRKEEANDAKVLKKLDRKFRKAAEALKRKEENMEQIKEEAAEAAEDAEALDAEALDAEALEEMDREIRKREKLKRKEQEGKTNINLAELLKSLKIK